MRALHGLLVIFAIAVVLLSVPSHASSAGTGIKVFAPSASSITVGQLPLSYNGSFIVQNDGLLEGVYIVRVAVDDPSAIAWVNVSPAGFVLAPGEMRQVNFSLDVAEGQAVPGTYHIDFVPALLPLNVEPYIDTFASYVSLTDRYNFTVVIPDSASFVATAAEPGLTPVTFGNDSGRLNLVQFVPPENDSRVVTQIDRAVRINVPSGAEIGRPVPVSLSVFEGLSSSGISLKAVSPDGVFYNIVGNNVTFDQLGRWGVVALVGDTVLLGRPVDVSEGGVRLVMPGIGTILAAIALLLLLALVPIWLMSRGSEKADPYDEIIYKACVIKKYVDQFDSQRLNRAVGQLSDEYNELVTHRIRGRREEARQALDELETLARLESASPPGHSAAPATAEAEGPDAPEDSQGPEQP